MAIENDILSTIPDAKVFPATTEGLAACSAYLEEALGQTDCPMPLVMKAMIAFDEIASNIVHYSGSPDFGVTLRKHDGPLSVEIIFADGGSAYNPLQKEDPDVTLKAEDRTIGGLGIFMTKKLMDTMDYRREGSLNVLSLKKLF